MSMRHSLACLLTLLVIMGLTSPQAMARASSCACCAHASMATPATRAYQQAMTVMHQQMQQPLSGDANVDFVRQMIPHHQAAVEMAKIQLEYGHDESLKSFSRWIIFAQEQEIAFMQTWLRGRDHGRATPGATDYYGPAMQTMHRDMMIDYSGDADRDFVRGMIPHHQGAAAMARIWMQAGSNPELRPLVSDIFRAQSYEIAWQHAWLARGDSTLGFPSLIF